MSIDERAVVNSSELRINWLDGPVEQYSIAAIDINNFSTKRTDFWHVQGCYGSKNKTFEKRSSIHLIYASNPVF